MSEPMKCSTCGSGPMIDGKTVYRNGPKGQKADWKCEEHLPSEARNEKTMRMGAVIESMGETRQ